MHIRDILFSLTAIIFSINTVFADSENSVKIALIAEKTSDFDKSPLVSLLEVELSKKEGVQLLERAAIDKILAEQQLSAAGLLDRTTAIKIGKLLRADAFIILSLENKIQDANDLIRVRVSETAHGLRLADFFEQSEKSNPKECIERIIQEIKSVLNKINQPDEKLIPVGIVDIHRVQLGEKYKILERTLPAMLSVRLNLEPQIIMLEREDLKVLLDEKLMTEGPDSEFWSSAILIDGYIQPNSGQLEMHLNLKQINGTNIKSLIVAIEPNTPSVGVDKAGKEIAKEILDAPPATQWNLATEAEQFYQKAQMLMIHQRYEEAIPLFETVHNLQPQNVFYTGTLFKNEWTSRVKHLEYNLKPYYTDLELAELVSIFVHQLHDLQKKELLSFNNLSYPGFGSLGAGSKSMGKIQYFSNSVSVTTEQIKLLNKETRRIWIETLEAAYKQQALQEQDPQMNISQHIARLTWVSSVDPDELINNVINAYSKLIMPPRLGGIVQSDSLRESICMSLFDFESNVPSGLTVNIIANMMKDIQLKDANGDMQEYINRRETYKSMNRFIVLWKKYINELGTYNDTVLTKISKSVLVMISKSSDNQSDRLLWESAKYEEIENMLNGIKNYDASKGKQAKQELLKRWRNFTTFNTVGEESVMLWENVCNILIEQDDYESLIMLNPGENPILYNPELDPQAEAEVMKRYSNLLERIKIVLENHNNNPRTFRVINRIKDFQVELKNKYPQLEEVTQTMPVLFVKILFTKEQILKNIQKVKNSMTYTTFSVYVKNDIIWAVVTLENIAPFHLRYLQSKNTNENINPGKIRAIENEQGSNFITLAGFNIAKNKLTTLWQAELSFTVDSLHTFIPENEKSYIWTRGNIIEFPGIQNEGHGLIQNPIIYQINNSPSVITSVAKVADKFWVAYGLREQESGLTIYDPNTDTWEIVFCSTLNDGKLLSNGKPYEINSLKYVNPDMLYFICNGIEPSGLWQMNTNTRELEYLGPIAISNQRNYGDAFEYIKNNLLIKSSKYLIELDTDSKTMRGIYGDMRSLRKSFMDKNLPVPDFSQELLNLNFLSKITFGPYYGSGGMDLSTAAIHKGKIWARLGESQIIIAEQGKNLDGAKILENNILDGKPVERFVSTPNGLIAIGEGIVGLIETENMNQ